MGFEYNIGDMIVTNQVEANYPYHEDPPVKYKKTRYGVILGIIEYDLKANYVPIDGPKVHKKFRIYWNETSREGKISIIEENIVQHEVERGHWMLVTNKGEFYDEFV